jgi:hypothetical protein
MLDTIPFIDIASLPPDEHADAFHIRSLLTQIAMSANDFQHALALFDHASALEAHYQGMASQTLEPTDNIEQFVARIEAWRHLRQAEQAPRAWKFIAARDAAMTVYHFSVALKAIRFGAKSTLSAQVDHGLIRRSRRDFRMNFPNAERMRNAVAHSAELLKSRSDVERNTFRKQYVAGAISFRSGGMMSNVLNDRTLTFSFMPKGLSEAQVVTLEISAQSVKSLCDVVILVFDAFRSVDVRRRLDPAFMPLRLQR